MISALFVQSDGCYSDDDRIDSWPESRDARNYNLNNPVICHPPCQLWGKMANVNYARWGGEHNKPGNDGGLFEFALMQVERCGGVLEHPAQSYAWKEYGLDKPDKNRWKRTRSGWTCEVWQSAYGHKANKATWLYYVGINRPFDLNWDRPVGTHQIGRQDQRGKSRNKPALGKSEASATPAEFKEVLIKLSELSGAHKMKTQYRCSAITAEGKAVSLKINTESYPDAHQQFMDYISVVVNKDAVKTLSGVNIEAVEVDDD